jgi:hypothetical protein
MDLFGNLTCVVKASNWAIASDSIIPSTHRIDKLIMQKIGKESYFSMGSLGKDVQELTNFKSKVAKATLAFFVVRMSFGKLSGNKRLQICLTRSGLLTNVG